MTINVERRHAVINTRQFLLQLINPKDTPKVPKTIRKQALRLLRHYPNSFDLEIAAKACPEIFGEWEYYAENKKPKLRKKRRE